MFQFFHHSLNVHIPEPGTAVVGLLFFHMKTWQREREERGWKREILEEQEHSSGCAAAHPEPDCAPQIQTAQMTPALGTFPTRQAFM